MRKIALIINERETDKKKSGFNKVLLKFRSLIDSFISNKIEISLIDEQITFYIIKIFVKEKTIKTKLEKLFDYIIEQQIEAVAFDQYFASNYYEDIQTFVKYGGVYLSEGENIYIPLMIRTLKKILKAKEMSLEEIDVAIVSKGDSNYVETFIRYLSPHVKYLTYVCKEKSNYNFLIDDIFDNMGFSIRTCNSINQCINEVSLIINLTDSNIEINNSKSKRLIICNIGNMPDTKTVPSNISVLNNIFIDISSVFKVEYDNQIKYKLCEMYILSKLDKLYLLNQSLLEETGQCIYNYFKKSGFNIVELDGFNL